MRVLSHRYAKNEARTRENSVYIFGLGQVASSEPPDLYPNLIHLVGALRSQAQHRDNSAFRPPLSTLQVISFN